MKRAELERPCGRARLLQWSHPRAELADGGMRDKMRYGENDTPGCDEAQYAG